MENEIKKYASQLVYISEALEELRAAASESDEDEDVLDNLDTAIDSLDDAISALDEITDGDRGVSITIQLG